MLHTKPAARVALGILLASCAPGCAKHEHTKNTNAERASETSGSMSQTESLLATVQEVDSERRVVTLSDAQGKRIALDIADSVDLTRIHPQDAVRITYQESVAFALATENETGDGPSVEESTRRIPEGVQFGRRIRTTVEIVSVTKDGSHATFRIPEGPLRTVYIDDTPSQEKIAKLRPGDAVAVTYTEKLAVAVDPAFDD
jgi:hypothetical protein